MVRIQPLRTQQVSPTAPATVNVPNRGSDGLAGQVIGDAVTDFALRERQKADRARLQRAVAEYRTEATAHLYGAAEQRSAEGEVVAPGRTGILTLGGEALLDALEAGSGELRASADSRIAELPTRIQQQARTFFDQEYLRYEQRSQAHASQQAQVMQVEALGVELASLRDAASKDQASAAYNPTTQQIDLSAATNFKERVLEELRAHVESNPAHAGNLSPDDWVAEQFEAEVSNYHAGVVDLMLANGDDGGARRYLQAAEGEVQSLQLAGLREDVRRANVEGDALRWVDQYMAATDSVLTVPLSEDELAALRELGSVEVLTVSQLLTQGRQSIRDQFSDPDARAEATRAFERRVAELEEQRSLRHQETADRLAGYLESNPGDLVGLRRRFGDDYRELPRDMRAGLDAMADAQAGSLSEADEDATFFQIQQQFLSDRDAFMRHPPAELNAITGGRYFNDIQKMRSEGSEGLRTQLQQTQEQLKILGWDKDAEKSQAYFKGVRAALDAESADGQVTPRRFGEILREQATEVELAGGKVLALVQPEDIELSDVPISVQQQVMGQLLDERIRAGVGGVPGPDDLRKRVAALIRDGQLDPAQLGGEYTLDELREPLPLPGVQVPGVQRIAAPRRELPRGFDPDRRNIRFQAQLEERDG